MALSGRLRLGIVGLACFLVLGGIAFAQTSVELIADPTRASSRAVLNSGPSGAIQAPAGSGIDLLVSQGSTYGFYGDSNWTEFSAVLDAAANSVSVTPDLENMTQIMGFRALWVDQRWTAGVLTATEEANLLAYIATGRRVVLIGENASWTAWNNQILGLVGGSFMGDGTGNLTPALTHELTAGVTTVSAGGPGVATGGTPVFGENVVTLWGATDNVLTILDVNIAVSWGNDDNAQFLNNVAGWLLNAAFPVELESFAIE